MFRGCILLIACIFIYSCWSVTHSHFLIICPHAHVLSVTPVIPVTLPHPPHLLHLLYLLQVNSVLAQIGEWTFDTFRLADVTSNRPLSTLSFALIKQSGILTTLKLDEARLARYGWLTEHLSMLILDHAAQTITSYYLFSLSGS